MYNFFIFNNFNALKIKGRVRSVKVPYGGSRGLPPGLWLVELRYRRGGVGFGLAP